MAKVYGQDFLTRIKNEELEERNKRAREEAEQRRKQLELRKQQKGQTQERESRKPGVKLSADSQTAKRPPFMVISEPFNSYRKF